MPSSSSGGGGGGGDPNGDPSSGSDGKDPKDPNAKKGQEEKKDPLADNKGGKDGKDEDPASGDPQGGKHNDRTPRDKARPPSSEKRPPTPQELKGVFFAKLPDKVREAVLNGDFDQVPEKYRELVREWTKALAEREAEEAK